MLFTRQPDYFNSEQTSGVIVEQRGKMVVDFSDGRAHHFAAVPYPLLHKPGDKVKVIYEAADPAKAKQYGLLGYWISFGELIVSLIIIIALYFVAVSITSHPTPGALIEEMEAGKKKPRKPKYDMNG